MRLLTVFFYILKGNVGRSRKRKRVGIDVDVRYLLQVRDD